MGESNSSVTRVWPVFEYLLNRDPAGDSWLLKLMELGSRAKLVDRKIFDNPGPLPGSVQWKPIPKTIKEPIGERRAAKIGKIRTEFEVDIRPSAPFLRWLLEHPTKLKWPKENGRWYRFSKNTQNNRCRLVREDTSIQKAALAELERCGVFGWQK